MTFIPVRQNYGGWVALTYAGAIGLKCKAFGLAAVDSFVIQGINPNWMGKSTLFCVTQLNREKDFHSDFRAFY